MKITYYISMLAVLFLFVQGAQAQDDWGITDEEKAEMLKVEFNQMSIELGEEAYTANACNSCHGTPAKGDNLAPNFPDLGTTEFLSGNTDGEIFYKITKGRSSKGMAAYEKSISETDRWNLVAYMRSFDKNYTPTSGEAVALEPGQEFQGEIASIDLKVNLESHKLIAKLKGRDAAGNSIIPMGVKVEFFTAGMFGNYLIGKAVKCDETGTATIEYPADLPADTAGMMTFYAQLKDEELGTLKGEASVDTGNPMVYKNPLSERVMWGPMANIPYWLLFTYLGIVIVVWGGIAWVGLQLFKIWMLREQ